jgi:hypothetical protein
MKLALKSQQRMRFEYLRQQDLEKQKGLSQFRQQQSEFQDWETD